MNKLSQIFQKWKDMSHQSKNAQELKRIVPVVTLYDMCHQFVMQENRQKKASTTAFFDTINKQTFVADKFFSKCYSDDCPEKQVVRHGIVFNALFNMYMKYTTKSFENAILYDSQINYLDDKITVSLQEYNKMPKCYRSAFVNFDDCYVLNTSYNNLVITYNNKNKKKLEELLYRAKTLIPAIYQEDKIANKTFDSTKPVSDEQLKIIRTLRDTFMEISKITFPIKTIKQSDSAALDIFKEYVKESNQKNIFMNTLKVINMAEMHKQQKIDDIKINYEVFRKALLQKLHHATQQIK